jgi:hypothetical protein
MVIVALSPLEGRFHLFSDVLYSVSERPYPGTQAFAYRAYAQNCAPLFCRVAFTPLGIKMSGAVSVKERIKQRKAAETDDSHSPIVVGELKQPDLNQHNTQ